MIVSQELQSELSRERSRSNESLQSERSAQSEVVRLEEEVGRLHRKLREVEDECEARVEEIHREMLDK